MIGSRFGTTLVGGCCRNGATVKGGVPVVLGACSSSSTTIRARAISLGHSSRRDDGETWQCPECRGRVIAPTFRSFSTNNANRYREKWDGKKSSSSSSTSSPSASPRRIKYGRYIFDNRFNHGLLTKNSAIAGMGRTNSGSSSGFPGIGWRNASSPNLDNLRTFSTSTSELSGTSPLKGKDAAATSNCDDCNGCSPDVPAFTSLQHTHDGTKVDKKIIEALLDNDIPFFSVFGPISDAKKKRICFLSHVEIGKEARENDGTSCTIEEIKVVCSDCGMKRTIESPKDFLDPKRNESGQAILMVCPSCAVVVKA